MALSHIRTGTDTCSWYAERDEKFRDPTVCMYTMHYEFTPIFVYEYTMYYATVTVYGRTVSATGIFKEKEQQPRAGRRTIVWWYQEGGTR